MFNPPRILNEPTQPLPQTVCITLEHSGVPTSKMQAITDIPPDFSWMANLQLYKGSFTVKTTDMPKTRLYKTGVHNHKEDPNLTGVPTPIVWNYIPLLASKWWTGKVSYKLIAIKPPRVTGKLLIRFSFDPYYDIQNEDALRRCVCKEWDLGTSSECEFDVEGVSPIGAHPTWLNEAKYISPQDNPLWAESLLPVAIWSYGFFQVEVAQRIQPGGIFPDQFRVLVFMSYKNSQFYQPTDMRGKLPHMLTSYKSDTAMEPYP